MCKRAPTRADLVRNSGLFDAAGGCEGYCLIGLHSVSGGTIAQPAAAVAGDGARVGTIREKRQSVAPRLNRRCPRRAIMSGQVRPSLRQRPLAICRHGRSRENALRPSLGRLGQTSQRPAASLSGQPHCLSVSASRVLCGVAFADHRRRPGRSAAEGSQVPLRSVRQSPHRCGGHGRGGIGVQPWRSEAG